MRPIDFVQAQIALGFYAEIYFSAFADKDVFYRHYKVKFTFGCIGQNISSFSYEFDIADKERMTKLDAIMIEQNKKHERI